METQVRDDSEDSDGEGSVIDFPENDPTIRSLGRLRGVHLEMARVYKSMKSRAIKPGFGSVLIQGLLNVAKALEMVQESESSLADVPDGDLLAEVDRRAHGNSGRVASSEGAH